jgi:hypothetical protein
MSEQPPSNQKVAADQRFTAGQRVVYIKRGELRHYDTEWRATYQYRTPTGKHAIRIDGRKRLSLVSASNLSTVDANP